MENFKLAEHFISINGEGQHAGELALFLRFAGCNLRCAWCDTMWANEKDTPFAPVSVNKLIEIAEQAAASGVHNITLTGGEPLLQPNIDELLDRLKYMPVRVEIETNGSVSLAPFVERGAVFTMDYKLPSSRMEQHMCTENFALLHEWDTVKFVCGSRADLNRAAEMIAQYQPKAAVYLSPVFGQIAPAEMVEFMKERGLGDVRLQLQLHKFIWEPQARGV